MNENIKKVKLLMLEETMKENDESLSSGKPNQNSIETRNGLNRTIYYLLEDFARKVSKIYFRLNSYLSLTTPQNLFS